MCYVTALFSTYSAVRVSQNVVHVHIDVIHVNRNCFFSNSIVIFDSFEFYLAREHAVISN